MDPQNKIEEIAKLDLIFEEMDNSYVGKDEFGTTVADINTSIQNTDTKLSSEILSVKDAITNISLTPGPKGDSIIGPEGPTGPQGLIGEQGSQGESITGLQGPMGLNGEIGPEGKPGKDGSPDTPIEVRDKLETLEGDERLDRKSIKGLDKVIEQDTLDRAVSVLQNQTSFLINKVGNISTGGSSTPGGSNTQLQYNKNGLFAGSSTLTYNDSTFLLTLAGTIRPTTYQYSNGTTFATASLLKYPGGGSNLADSSGNLYWGGSNHVLTDNSGQLYTNANHILLSSTGSLLYSVSGQTMSDGTDLNYPSGAKMATGNSLLYSGGLTLTDGSSIYSSSGTTISNSSGLTYGNNTNLADFNNLYYSNAAILADSSGQLYYGNGSTVMSNSFGQLYYGDGSNHILADHDALYYNDTGSISNHYLADNLGNLYYCTGNLGSTKLADFNGNLYAPFQLIDGSSSAGTSGYILKSTGTAVAWTAPTNLGLTSITTNVARTNQGADVTTTTLTSTVGTYRVSYSLQDTTSDVTAGIVTLTIGYTDGAGATTATATQTLTGVGRSSGSVYLQLASGNLTYATSHTGIFGSAKYALYLSVERLS